MMIGNKMAMALDVYLNAEEISGLTDTVRIKLCEAFSGCGKKIDELKIQQERLQVNNEQSIFEWEAQLKECRQKLEVELERARILDEKTRELDTKLLEGQGTLQKVQGEKFQLSNDLGQIERQVEALNSEKLELVQLLEKKNKEVDHWNEEWTSLSEKLSVSHAENLQYIAKLQDSASRSSTLELRDKRLEQEKDLMRQQIESLNVALAEKNNELLVLRKEKYARVLDLQTQLHNVTAEMKANGEAKEILQKTVEDKSEKIDKLIEQRKESNDANVRMEEQYRQELRAQVKLSELYKDAHDKEKAAVVELTSAFEEVQNLLKQTTSDCAALQQELHSTKEEMKTELDMKDEEITKLQKELNDANTLLSETKDRVLTDDEIEKISPSAATVSRMMRSGMTLTQLYSELVTAKDKLLEKEAECKQLNLCLNEVVQQLKERAPMVKKLREDYDKAIETISTMRHKNSEAVMEYEKMCAESEDSRFRSIQLEKENKRLQLQLKDLSQQVCVLLRESEEARGGVVSRSNVDNSDQVSSSSQVITQRMVAFRSIEELQRRNCELLAVARELSSKQEEAESKELDARRLEMETTIRTALKEVQELKESKERQMTTLESIVRQRDMYRMLLSQSANLSDVSAENLPPVMSTPVNRSSPMVSPNISVTQENAELKEKKMALEQTELEFNNYKTQKKESDKILSEQSEKQRDELSKAQLENAKLLSKVEFASERYKNLKANFDGYKKELALLNEKNQRLSTVNMKQEDIINSLREEAMSVQQKLSQAEVGLENLRAEHELLKRTEAVLQHENETQSQKYLEHNLLAANLQAIQTQLERSQDELKTRLNSRIEILDRECATLQRKLDRENDIYKDSVSNWENELRKVQAKFEAEVQKHLKTRDELVDSYSIVHGLKQEVTELEAKVKSAESSAAAAQLQSPGADKPMSRDQGKGEPAKETEQQTVQFLRLKMKDLQNENTSVNDQLKLSKDSIDQYKNLAANFESQLQEQIQENRNLYKMMQEKLNAMSTACAAVKEECERAKKDKSDMELEVKRLTEECETKINAMQSEVKRAQVEFEKCQLMKEEAVRNITAVQRESQDQFSHAREAQDKYERELMLHAADVKAFAVLKTQLESANGKIASAEAAARQSENALKCAKDSWLVQEVHLKKENERIVKKCEELEKQNELLYSEIDKMSLKLSATRSSEGLNRSFGESSDTEKSSEQLLEVIKFLRKGKEMSDTKNEVTAAECQRLRIKLEMVERQLSEMQELNDKQQQQTQASIATAAQHAELLQKIQMLNVLTDSNRLLREQHSSLEQQNKALEAKVHCLQTEISPLQESQRELAKQKEVLQTESQALKVEVKRWQTHAQQLLEQTNKMKPEDYQRALQDKEILQAQVNSLQEEVHRLKAEISQMNMLKVDIANLNVDLQTKTQQLKRSGEEVENREAQMAEQAKTILQIKKIGRKYKTQYDELKAQYDLLLAKEGQDAQKELASKQEAAVAAAQEAGVQEGKHQMEAKVQESDEKAKQLALQIQQKDEELVASKKLEETFRATDEKSRKLLQSARQRIVQLNAQRDEQARTLEDLRAKLSTTEQIKEEEILRSNTIKSQYEAQIGRLESSVSEARENLSLLRQENEQLHHEVEELSHRISQMQRPHLGQSGGAKLQSAAGPSREGSILAQSSESPPTANIKPIPTRTENAASSRPPHPLGVSTTSGSSTRTTPTASIRPIPATSSTARMAAVTPTTAAVSMTVVHSDAHEGHTPSPPSVPQATVAPTAAVVPVTATVSPTPVVEPQAEIIVDVDDSNEQLVIPEEEVAVPEAATEEIAGEAGVEHFSSQSGVATALVNPLVEQSHIEEDSKVASSSHDTRIISHVQGLTPGKRARDDGDSSDTFLAVNPTTSQAADRSPMKRTRMTVEVTSTSPEKSMSRSARTVPDENITMARNNDDLEVESGGDVYGNLVPVTSSGDNRTGQDSPEVDSDIIVVTSDEETQEQIEEGDEDDERDYRDDQYDEEHMQEEEGDLDDKAYDADDMIDEDEEVEIIDEVDEDEQPMEEPEEEVSEQPGEDNAESSQVPAQSTMGDPSSHGRPSCLPRIPMRTERLPSAGRQQQLTPFAPMGSGTGFEDGDSIVPSTPTLFDPRRSDGFAEALSSPQVPQGRFLFGSSQQEAAVPSCHSALSQLASQGALGVDDTRMDLSQFDDGSGRSVPTTPLQVSPPAETMNTEGSSELASESATAAVIQQVEEAATSGVTSSSPAMVPPFQSGDMSHRDIPSITVTSEEDAVLGVDEIVDDSIVISEETVVPIIEEPDNISEAAPSDLDHPVIVEVTTSAEEGAGTSRESSNYTVQTPEERGTEGTDHHFGSAWYGRNQWYQGSGNMQQYHHRRDRQQQQMQRRPTPIVWNEPSTSRVHGSPMPHMGAFPPGVSPGQNIVSPSPPQMQGGFGRGSPRMSRGRRIRLAGGMQREVNPVHGVRAQRGGLPQGSPGIGRGERGIFRQGWRGGSRKGRGARPPRS